MPPAAYNVIADATETLRSLLVGAATGDGLLSGVQIAVELPTGA